MGFKPGVGKESSKTALPVLEPGAYPATCYRVVHFGTLRDDWNGQERLKDKVSLSFELLNAKAAFPVFDDHGNKTDKTEEKNRSVFHTIYNCIIRGGQLWGDRGQPSTAFLFFSNWRGQNFTKGEAERFDIADVVGQHALLSIGVYVGKEDGQKRNRINSIGPKAPKLEEYEPEEPEAFFTITSCSSREEVVQRLKDYPDWYLDECKKSVQWEGLPDTDNGFSRPGGYHQDDDEADDGPGAEEAHQAAREADDDDLPF